MASLLNMGGIFDPRVLDMDPSALRNWLAAQGGTEAAYQSSIALGQQEMDVSKLAIASEKELGFARLDLDREIQDFNELVFATEKEFKEKAFEAENELAWAKIGLEEEAHDLESYVQKGNLNLKGQQVSAESSYRKGLLDIEKEKLQLAKSKAAREEESYDNETGMVSDWMDLFQQGIDATNARRDTQVAVGETGESGETEVDVGGLYEESTFSQPQASTPDWMNYYSPEGFTGDEHYWDIGNV